MVHGDNFGLPDGVVKPIGKPEFTGVYTTPEQLSEELLSLGAGKPLVQCPSYS